jgi:GDP-L-fucose synthase
MEKYDDEEIINIGTGEDVTIKELAETIIDVTGYENDYEWDTSKPNGTPRKVLNVDKMKALGWEQIFMARMITSFFIHLMFFLH